MKTALLWVVILAAVLAGGWWFWNAEMAERETASERERRPQIAPATEVTPPPPQHPITNERPSTAAASNETGEIAEPEEPLPLLYESDPVVIGSLSDLFGPAALGPYLVPDAVIPRIVATVDNLPAQKFAPRAWPIQGTEGQIVAAEDGESLVLSEENAARYEGLLAMAESVSPQAAAEMYRQYYPLFQKAYEDLGYPDAYFNDRLVVVIDHLLETPEPEGPILLEKPEAFYQFADPELENLSFGQKTLLRMGPENARRVKGLLRAFRAEVVSEQNEAE